MSVSAPKWRESIILEVQDLANPEVLKNKWVERRGVRNEVTGFWSSVDLLFDDCCNLDNPEEYLGVSLVSQNEVDILRSLGEAMNSVIDSINNDFNGQLSDAEILRMPEFRDVTRVARKALAILRQ